jgi:L-ascorbate metabolism protein UlaG (beta-lactamase superfamily)
MATQQDRLRRSRSKDLDLEELVNQKLHRGNGRFINPFATTEHGNFFRVLRWKWFSKNRFETHYKEEPTREVRIDWGPVKNHRGGSVTFIKHATILMKDVDRYLILDPLLFNLLWFKDFSPLAFDPAGMPTPDHILITHGHYDHLDKKTLDFFPKNTHVISPLGYNGVFDDLGMNHRTQLDWLDAYKDGELEIILLPCNHWTMRNPFIGPNDSLWGSFLVRGASGHTIFVSGDIAYFDRFEELGQRYPIDLAIFNLGAYEPRWFMAGSHINPEETVKAFRQLKAKRLLVIHWGTFRLGDEPVHFPPRDIQIEMEKAGLQDRLIHLDHGETYFLS